MCTSDVILERNILLKKKFVKWTLCNETAKDLILTFITEVFSEMLKKK